jgi:hypothetical protein
LWIVGLILLLLGFGVERRISFTEDGLISDGFWKVSDECSEEKGEFWVE